LEYYQVLRSILRRQPHRRRCLTRCRHCRIFFLTDPRNAGRKDERKVGRKDLGCPFGCRKAHRRQQSTRRSVAYYQTDDGKRRKRDLNQRRPAAYRSPAPAQEAQPEPQAPPPPAPRPMAVQAPWPEPLVQHVRVVVRLIEGRSVSRAETLQLLAQVLRQHRLARRRKIDHTVAWLNEHPP